MYSTCSQPSGPDKMDSYSFLSVLVSKIILHKSIVYTRDNFWKNKKYTPLKLLRSSPSTTMGLIVTFKSKYGNIQEYQNLLDQSKIYHQSFTRQTPHFKSSELKNIRKI